MFKKQFLTVVAVLFLQNLFAQDTSFFYFDANWRSTSKPEAVYYRKALKHENGYKVWDFYKNGTLQMKGFYSDHIFENRQDTFEYYYPNKQLRSKGVYHNDTAVGEWSGWFEDGKKDFIFRYNGDKRKLAFYHKNGLVSAIEEYENDTVLVRARLWDSTGEVSKNRYIEIRPSFNGQEVNFTELFDKTMHFPEDSEGNPLYGKVSFYIVVDEDGVTSYGESYGFVHPEMENMIKRAVNKFPKFTPAILHNRVTAYSETFRFDFKKD